MQNYYSDKYGVLHQIDRVPNSRLDYGAERNDYGQISHYLSYLRLGYIQGVIPKIEKYQSICDAGFGNGDFLRACQRQFNLCAGYDLIYDYLPNGCFKEIDLLSGDRHYDIVTFFDSLEHFEDNNVLHKIDCDFVVISVPNCKFPEDDFWFSKWKHRKPNEHLHHFNEKSIVKFLKGEGFKTLNISYMEDIIRKAEYSQNILTVVGQKV